MKEIPLTQGKVAIVDDDDYAELSQHKWCVHRRRSLLYAVRIDRQSRKFVQMHRLIAGTPKGMDTDHKNGNGLDNRRENLRICSRAENTHNRRKQCNNTSGFRGVSWRKITKKWRARIMNNGKTIMLGSFEKPEVAARTYDEAAKELHGEFAKTNF